MLLDHKGRRFVTRFHQDGELATRDVVSRAIHAVMREHELEQVWLDMRPIGAETIAERFPGVVEKCRQYGIDVFNQAIPVHRLPLHDGQGALHAYGLTSIEGLRYWQCACTGLHGANRLASNSLLEAGVMALNLADTLSNSLAKRPEVQLYLGQDRQKIKLVVPADLATFRAQMYRWAGLVRSQSGLTMLLNTPCCEVDEYFSAEQYSARNIYQVGQLIARAALTRRESRGSHLRDDFTGTDDKHFSRHLWLSQEGQGWEDLREMLYH